MFKYNYLISIRKFYLDHGFLHASALTFYSIFAIVPILATAFGVAKGFGLEAFLDVQLEKSFPGQENTTKFLSEYAQNLLSQSSGGLIAGIGILVLFYSVYNMLSHIERSLNRIWQIPESRNISARISHYLSLILIGPTALILASALKIFIANHVHYYSGLQLWSSNFLPLLLMVSLLYWLYKYMPNTKVNSKAALFGAVNAGVAYILCQSLLIESQLMMNNYSAVYGGFAALPIFLIWVQISWFIVLFGAQLCFVFQNGIRNIWELNFESLSLNNRNILLLKIANSCIDKFNSHKSAPSVHDLALELDLPPSLVQQLIVKLTEAKILAKIISTHSDEISYHPAGNSALINEHYILESLKSTGY